MWYIQNRVFSLCDVPVAPELVNIFQKWCSDFLLTNQVLSVFWSNFGGGTTGIISPVHIFQKLCSDFVLTNQILSEFSSNFGGRGGYGIYKPSQHFFNFLVSVMFHIKIGIHSHDNNVGNINYVVILPHGRPICGSLFNKLNIKISPKIFCKIINLVLGKIT